MKEKMRQVGLTVYPSEANYIFFYGPEDLFERCVAKGILIRDCSNYPGLKKGYYRAASCMNRIKANRGTGSASAAIKVERKGETKWQKQLWCRGQCPMQESLLAAGLCRIFKQMDTGWHPLNPRIWT